MWTRLGCAATNPCCTCGTAHILFNYFHLLHMLKNLENSMLTVLLMAASQPGITMCTLIYVTAVRVCVAARSGHSRMLLLLML